MADYPVHHLTSFKNGTLISIHDFLFFDRNNNGVLDKKDVRVEYGNDVDFKCSGNLKETDNFCIANVNKDDIRKYGPTVSRLFRLARKERSMMKNVVKPQREGVCVLERGDSAAVFAQPLSLRTVTFPEHLRYDDIPNEKSEKPTIDPRKCRRASASFVTIFRGRKLRMKINAADRFCFNDAFYVQGLLTYLGLEEAGPGSSPLSVTSVHYEVPSLEGDFTLYHVYLVAKTKCQCRQIYLNKALK